MGNITHVFGIDPGEVRTGFVWIKYDHDTQTGDTKIMKIYDPEELFNILKMVWGLVEAGKENPPEIKFVVENFRVNSNDDPRKKTWFWDEVKTIRVIGAIELAANWCGAKITLQEPTNVLPMARKWAPFKMAQHPRDDHSAWCHAVYWLKRRGYINTPDQIAMYGQDKLG